MEKLLPRGMVQSLEYLYTWISCTQVISHKVNVSQLPEVNHIPLCPQKQLLIVLLLKLGVVFIVMVISFIRLL